MDAQSSSIAVEPSRDELTAPHLDLIRGLREAADWLEQHPELPAHEYATVSFGYDIRSDARKRLTALAQALGDRAAERCDRDRVSVNADFGALLVTANAKVRALVDAPPEPTNYEPIIPVTT